MLNPWHQWIVGWLELVSGVARILSAGLWTPGWTTSYRLYALKRLAQSFEEQAVDG